LMARTFIGCFNQLKAIPQPTQPRMRFLTTWFRFYRAPPLQFKD